MSVKETSAVITVEIVYAISNHCKHFLTSSSLLIISFRDCPFEEHAAFYPSCDYIIHKRGLSYIERILKESIQSMFKREFDGERESVVLVRQARQKYEVCGPHKIKLIFFGKTGEKHLNRMN